MSQLRIGPIDIAMIKQNAERTQHVLLAAAVKSRQKFGGYKPMARDMREQGKIPVCELKGGGCLAPLEALSAWHGGNVHSPIVPHACALSPSLALRRRHPKPARSFGLLGAAQRFNGLRFEPFAPLSDQLIDFHTRSRRWGSFKQMQACGSADLLGYIADERQLDDGRNDPIADQRFHNRRSGRQTGDDLGSHIDDVFLAVDCAGAIFHDRREALGKAERMRRAGACAAANGVTDAGAGPVLFGRCPVEAVPLSPADGRAAAFAFTFTLSDPLRDGMTFCLGNVFGMHFSVTVRRAARFRPVILLRPTGCIAFSPTSSI